MIYPSRILLAPFVMIIAFIGYQLYEGNGHYLPYLVAVGIPAIILYFLGNEIDWWWWTKYPPKLAPQFTNIMRNHIPYYRDLSASEKKRFQDRVALFLKGNEFMPMAELAMGLEEGEIGYSGKSSDDVPKGTMPADIMLVIAATCVQMTFGLKKFLLNKFDHVIVYPRPFPSPQHPKHFHLCETFKEDKVIMFASEPLLHYYTSVKKAYSIGHHEYGNAFEQNYPKINWPDLGKDIWDNIEKISGYGSDKIHQYINLPMISARPVSISLFFTHPDAFKATLPELYRAYTKIFNQNPINGHDPVIVELI